MRSRRARCGPKKELHHYHLYGDKRLVEATHVRHANAFGSRMTSILVWERE